MKDCDPWSMVSEWGESLQGTVQNGELRGIPADSLSWADRAEGLRETEDRILEGREPWDFQRIPLEYSVELADTHEETIWVWEKD